MYKKQASTPQLKQWIVTYIINTDSAFSRKKEKQLCALKVIGHISGPGGDGTIIKHCTDGEVFIRTMFTAKAMRSFFTEMDDADSQLDWGSALLILEDYGVHLHEKEYVLRVDNFHLWDLQQGFRRKNTLIHCMLEHRVHQKMLEEEKFQRKNQKKVARADNSLEDSLRLTLLLEEIGQASQESSVSVGPSGVNTPKTSGLPQERIQNTTDDAPGETTGSSERRCLKALLEAPFDVQEFLISTQELEQLQNIKGSSERRYLKALLEAPFDVQEFLISTQELEQLQNIKGSSERRCLKALLEAPFDVQEFLISTQELEQLQNIKEWRDDYCPASSLCETMNSENHEIAVSLKTMAEEERKKKYQDSGIQEKEAICNSSSIQKMPDVQSITSKTTGLRVISPKLESCNNIPISSNRTAKKMTVEFESRERHKFDASSQTSSDQKIMTGSYIDCGPREHDQSEFQTLETSTWQNEIESVRLSCRDHQISPHGLHLDTTSIHLDSQLASPSAHSTQREPQCCEDNSSWSNLQENQLLPAPLDQMDKDTINTDNVTSSTGSSHIDKCKSFVPDEHSEKSRSHCTQKVYMTMRKSSRHGKDVTNETQPLVDKMSLDKNVQHKTFSNKPGYFDSSVHSDAEQRISMQEMDDEHSGVDFETQAVDCRKPFTRAAVTTEQNLQKTSRDSIPATLPFLLNIFPETQPFNPSLSPEIDISKDKMEEERLYSLTSSDLNFSKEQAFVKDHLGSHTYFDTSSHKEASSSLETKTNCATHISKLKPSVLQQMNANECMIRIRKSHERGSQSHEKDVHVISEERHENERLLTLARVGLDGGRFAEGILRTFNSRKIETNNKLDSELSSNDKQLRGDKNVDVATRECDSGNLSASVRKNVPKLKGRVSDGVHVGQMDEIHLPHALSQAVKRKLVLDIQEEKKSILVTKKLKTDRPSRGKTEFVNDILMREDKLSPPGNSYHTSKSIVKGGDSAMLEKSSKTDVDQKYVWNTGKTRSCTLKSIKSKETNNMCVEDLENRLTTGRSKRQTKYVDNVMLDLAETGMIKDDNSLQREAMQNAGETLLTKISCAGSSEDSTLRSVWQKGKSHDKVLDRTLPKEGSKNEGSSVFDHDKALDKIENWHVQYDKPQSDSLYGRMKYDSTHILKQGLEATVKPIDSMAVKPKSFFTVKPRSYVAGDGKYILKEDQTRNWIDGFMEELSVNLCQPKQTNKQNVKIKSQERTSSNLHEKDICKKDAILRELVPSEVSDIGKQLLHLHFPDHIRTAAVQYLLEET
ncbi:hypothetical protein CHS0354_017211 [Potamilus streckersoni]|uniref:Uncharacterized protein n=1 Tax=Potamilus streckersoni TaxID=2493646 RepID=A0AAE0RY52_9BIVA|nr:hypothetical protein CHS0354_017211 [Potamilus streckersoni]